VAQPLRWNTPAFRWNAPGVVWNGQQPSKTTPSTKVVIDFSGYSADELGNKAQAIHDAIVANAALFPQLPFTMVAFQATITDYDAKNLARASKATSDILAFEVARHGLEDDLNVLGNYINSVANGDPVLCDARRLPHLHHRQRARPDAARRADRSALAPGRLERVGHRALESRPRPEHEPDPDLHRRPQRRGQLEGRRLLRRRQSSAERHHPRHHPLGARADRRH
jgi:hypothetical protein